MRLLRCAFVVVWSAALVGPSLAGDRAGKPASPLAADGAIRVTCAELDALVGNRLLRVRSDEYQARRLVLEDHLAERLLAREAASRGTTVEDLTRAEIEAKARPVTGEDVRAVYESAKAQFAGQGEEQARTQIRESMRRDRIARRRAEFVKELRAASGVRILLEPPRVDVGNGEGVTRGSNAALVTIVEYSDFQCPYCGELGPTLRQIEAKYGNDVRLEFRDFPLPFHQEARKAAESAHCAGEQGRFWEMHDTLFANQKALGVADLKRYAVELGLDADAFGRCLDSGRHDATWNASRKRAESYGVVGTPTLFVNGRFVEGLAPFEALDEIVGEELQRAKNAGAASRVPGPR